MHACSSTNNIRYTNHVRYMKLYLTHFNVTSKLNIFALNYAY